MSEDYMVISNRHVPQATFAFREDGETLLNYMRAIADKFGVIRLQDYCDLADIPCYTREMAFIKPYLDYGYWTSEDLKNASCRKTSGRPSFYLYLPNFRINREDYYKAEKNSTSIEEQSYKEENTMATTTNKSYDYTATPEELELEKAIKEVTEEAEKKIMDIRIELSKKLEALRMEYNEKEAIKREERQAHAWKRKYDALLKEGFSVEQAWEMTMESFKVD